MMPAQLLARPIISGSDMLKLSTVQFCERVGISRTTLQKWMLASPPKVKFRSYTIGEKTHYEFEEEEANRIKRLMPKKRQKGKPYLKSR